MRRARTGGTASRFASAAMAAAVAAVGGVAAAGLVMGLLSFFVPPFRFDLEAEQAAQAGRLTAAEGTLGDAVLRCDGAVATDLDILRYNGSAACWNPALLPPDVDVVNRLCANQTLSTGDLVVYDAADACYLAIPPATDPVNLCAGDVPTEGQVLRYDGGDVCYRTVESGGLLDSWLCAPPAPPGTVLAWNGTCLGAVPLADLDQRAAVAELEGALSNATLWLDGRVTALDGRLSAAEANITALEGRVSASEGDIAALEGRVSAAEGNITALDGRLSTTEGDVGVLEGRVSATEGNLTALDARVSETEAYAAALEDSTPLAYLQTIYSVPAEAAYSPSSTYAVAAQTIFNENNTAADALLVLSLTWADPLPSPMPPRFNLLFDPGGGTTFPNDPLVVLVPRAGETATVYAISQFQARATNGDELIGGPGGPLASSSWLVASPWRAMALTFSIPETHFNVDAFRWVLSDFPASFYSTFSISIYNRP